MGIPSGDGGWDAVAEAVDGTSLLVGEAKWTSEADVPRLCAALRRKAQNLPLAQGRTVFLGLWTQRAAGRLQAGVRGFGPRQVLASLR